MAAEFSETLIDRIYEASVVPEHWPSILSDLAHVGEGALASFFVLKNNDLRWVGTPEATS